MAKWQYEKGLHDLGNGLYGYLVPDPGGGATRGLSSTETKPCWSIRCSI